ncbi:MAG: PTS sugar transporter subunit IIA [Myxococcota bacterium]
MRLSVKDVAGLLGVSEKTVYRWVGEGRIPSLRVGDQLRFSRGEILEWATAHRPSVSPSIGLEPDSEGLPLPSLATALERGGIFFRVEAADRDGALRSVVRSLRLPGDIDPERVFESLRVREELASTGIGDGIALPHPRNPVLLEFDEPAVTLCLLERPVDFGAIDGQPVFALFAVLSPTIRGHLHLLGRTAFVLRDPGVLQALRDQASRDALLSEIQRVERDLTSPADGDER